MLTGVRGDNSLAILCLTEAGSRLGLKLLTGISDGVLFVPVRLRNYLNTSERVRYFYGWEDAFQEAYTNFKGLICIMATGIVVRSLATRLQSKFLDPAVVVMDEKGRYAISLLSGHVGGGNELARQAARVAGSEAVITTATDVQGCPAVDLMALEMNAFMQPVEHLKIINRSLAEGRTVYLYSPWPLSQEIVRGFCHLEWPQDGEPFKEPAVIISHQSDCKSCGSETIQLKPRNLALGVGSRKGVSWTSVKEALALIEDRFHVDPACIRALATIDFKAQEPAIKKLALEREVPLLAFSKQEILSLEGTYSASDWVQEKIGVGGVCEPAALLATQPGITLVPKQKIGPVTLSLAMEKSWWWDWDQVNGGI